MRNKPRPGGSRKHFATWSSLCLHVGQQVAQVLGLNPALDGALSRALRNQAGIGTSGSAPVSEQSVRGRSTAASSPHLGGKIDSRLKENGRAK